MSPASLIDEIKSTAPVAPGNTIADLFAAQARRTPEQTAVIARDGRLTYRELDERANRLAGYLRGLVDEKQVLIGIAIDRSLSLVCSLLGVLKAGAAYVPLDPNYPQERLSWIIENSEMRVALSTAAIRDRIQVRAGGLRVLDVDDPAISKCSPETVPTVGGAADLAYVIYTSGSTGRPKGVMIENRNVVNFFHGMDRAIGCGPGVWLAVTSICFDISVLELLWTLTRGFTVVVHEDQNSATIADEIRRHGVTHVQMTPSLARMLTFDAEAFAALGLLKQILLGGETVPASLIRRIRQVFSGEIYNMYGPTETTVWSTTDRVVDSGASVSIGRPIVNTEVFILDESSKPVPKGETGELFIGGEGVARGYWRRPDLTAERFVSIRELADSRLYRTGDLARFLADGRLDFLGRADYQIKLRGHRIEPGEIEAMLEESQGIRQAVVVLREDREGDARLVAYLVGDSEGHPGSDELRSFVASRLPDFMAPSNYIFLPELPYTDNGKIDRKALLKMPFPSQTDSSRVESAAQPANEIERIVADAWQDALGVPTVGRDENFFDLGAHSLTVAEVHARLQELLGRRFALVDLFEFPTVSKLATHLAGVHAKGQGSDRAQRRRSALQH